MKVLIFFFLVSFVAQAKETAPPLSMGKLIKDCLCQPFSGADGFVHAPKTKYKKDFLIEGDCRPMDAHQIMCHMQVPMDVLLCPKECLQVVEKKPLTKEEKVQSIEKIVGTVKASYAKVIPPVVMASLSKNFPNWYPILIDPGPLSAYFSDYSLPRVFHLELPVQIEPQFKSLSIIYFHKNLEDLFTHKSQWSFWDSKTGELIFAGQTPYPTQEGVYINGPCLVPLGNDLKSIVLAGQAGGYSDKGGCCGPYDLSQLKAKGPVLITDERKNDSKVYEHCRDGVVVINGPANLRQEPSAKSKIVGECPDKSLAIIYGRKPGWLLIDCQGKDGWTVEQNIRR